jgi:hypothetical protein
MKGRETAGSASDKKRSVSLKVGLDGRTSRREGGIVSGDVRVHLCGQSCILQEVPRIWLQWPTQI